MEWQKYFDTVKKANSIHQTSDGGYIVAGRKTASPYYDVWVAKLAPNGATEWQKILGGSNGEEANSVQQTSDGGYVIAGYTHSNDRNVSGNHGYSDLWIVKLNPIGVLQWQKCLGGSNSDSASSIQQTTDGGYIVAGSTTSNDGDVSLNQGSSDYWIVKIDSEGTIQWQRCLGGSSTSSGGLDNANSIQQTSDGGYIVAGFTNSNDGEASYNHGSYDFLVVKLDSKGATEWQKCLGGSSSDQAYGIQQTVDGGYIVAGSTESNDGDVSGNHGGSDFWIAKINPQTTPKTPVMPLGPAQGLPGISYSYSTSATDPYGDSLKYTFDWGDGSIPSQTAYLGSGTTASASHSWANAGNYRVKAMATNSTEASSEWSDSLSVVMSTSNPPQNKCLGGSGNDRAYSIHQTSDGGYIVAGSTSSNDSDVSGNHGLNDAWVAKLDSNKAIQWQKCLGSGRNDYANYISQTSDGGYIVSGYSEDTGWPYSNTAWATKLSSRGDLEWQKIISRTTLANSIQQTTDGGYILAGGTGDNYMEYNSSIVKLAPNGAIEWQAIIGGSKNEEAKSIQQTSDGGYIVAGYAGSNDGDVSGNHGLNDYWIVKLSSSGSIQWQKCLGGSNSDSASSIQQTTDGGYIVAGSTTSNDGDVSLNQGSSDYWIVKIDSEGTIQWQRCLGGSSSDQAHSIQQTSDGGYIVAGFTNSNDGEASYNHGSSDFLVVKLDSKGATEWQKCLGGSSSDQGFSVQQTTDGGYIVAGFAESNDGDVSGNHGGSDFWVVKIAPTTPPTTPTTPSQPQGPASGYPGVSYSYSTSATDPNGGQLKYTFDWGDGTAPSQTGYFSSGATASASHAWSTQGTYQIKAKATDSKGASSGWSESRAVTIRSSNTIAIDESASQSWIDIFSSNANDKRAVIWYEIEQDGSSGMLVVEVEDSEGKIYKWDEGLTTRGRHSLIWDGRVANEYVSQPKNPYYISLILQDNGKEVARSAKHKVWVGRPMILLHGIWSSKEKMETCELYKKLNERFYVKSIEYNGGNIKSSIGDIRRYAGKLNDEIDAIKLDTGAKKVDIVAHSMGGLVARWYVQKTNKQDVGRLIMIGTPNHGSDLANLPKSALKLILEKYFAGDSILQEYSMDSLIDQIFSNFNVAIFELAPHSKFLQELNGNDGCAYNIENKKEYDDKISESCRYSVVTSDNWFPTLTHMHSTINIFGYRPLDVFWATSGDGVVPRFSAKLSDVSIWFEDNSSHNDQIESQAIINQVSLLLQQDDNVIQYRPSSHLEEKLGSNKMPVYWTNPIEDKINQGEVKYYNITIDPTSTKAHFLVVWDNGTLNAALLAPNGSEIEMQSEGNSAYYSIQSPNTGNWTAKISPINIPLSGANLIIQAFIQNPLFIGVYTEKNTFNLQEPIEITAYLGDNESGFAGALVKANISKPDGTTDTITLYDDGLHNDNQTADGVYSNEYMNASSFGRYSIMVSASGSMDDYNFKRETFTTVWIEHYPDLTVNSSMIYFSNNTPITGDNITITAEIRNIGDSDAANASVLFYDNDPASGVLIGEDVIDISSGESALASISWTATSGWHDIHVLISPFNEFMEDSYANNNASKLIIIKPLPTLHYPDFTDTYVFSSLKSISISPFVRSCAADF